ncbi:MAG TPA: hypothetical protein VIG06_24155, partial [Kofleriaceae bacterium]
MLLALACGCGDSAALDVLDATSSDEDSRPARDDAGGGAAWAPVPGTSWQWQLDGAIDTSFDVAMY